MAEEGAAPPPLPRALDVGELCAARAAEVLALYQTVVQHDGPGAGLRTSFPRHLRRRATSHNRYCHQQRPNVRIAALLAAAGAPDAQRPTNRAMRRRPSRLRLAALQSCARDLLQPATDAGSADRSPPARRLETHLWHAKRMVMRCVYGHVLAVQAPGRGRGSRAVAHAARAGCAAHDASYVGALQLEGSATQLRMALELVADPTAVADLFRAPLFREGRCEAALALHACGAWPRGALAPAKLLLRHQQAVNGPARAAGGGASMREAGAGDTDMSDACAEPMQLDVPVEHRARRARGGRGRSGDTAPVRRSLLLWVHAAAYSDVHAALSAALEALADPGLGLAGPSGWAAGMAPTLTSRSAQLRRIELVGARAVAAASHALTPAQPSLAAVLMAALGAHSELAIALTDGMALGLRATHPQLASPLAKASSSATEGRNLLPALWSSKEVDGLLVDAAPLWDAAHPTVPSISGSALGAARRAARLQRLHLPLPLPGEDAGGGGATTFPALILFRRTPGGLPAVSLVLPAGWVAPVWAALSFSGARPAGQLEWRWLSTLAGLPFFPHDFPDTAAYAQHNEELRAGQRAAAADRLSGRAPPQPAGPHVPWCMVGRSARDAGCSAAPSCEDERPCVARASHQLGSPIGEPLAAATVLIDGKGGCEEGACVLVASTSGGVGGAPGWAIAGFVTTAFPRGHPGYPGGRAYCSWRLLAAATAAANASGAETAPCSHIAAGRVAVAVLNPSSPLLKAAHAWPVLGARAWDTEAW